LLDADRAVDFSALGTSADRTAVIATTPLADEIWTRCQPGDLLMFRNGELIRRAQAPVPPDVLATARYAPSEWGIPVAAESGQDA